MRLKPAAGLGVRGGDAAPDADDALPEVVGGDLHHLLQAVPAGVGVDQQLLDADLAQALHEVGDALVGRGPGRLGVGVGPGLRAGLCQEEDNTELDGLNGFTWATMDEMALFARRANK